MIFKYNDYIHFFSSVVGQSGARTGMKGQLAKAMGCQQTYLSKVMKRQANINSEQAFDAASFLKLTEDETEYLLLLVEKERAGTPKYKKHMKKKVESFQQKKLSVEESTQIEEFLSKEHQQIYYSSWVYSAAHIAVSLKTCHTVEGLAEALGVDREQMALVVEFLLSTGLMKLERGKLLDGPTHIHLKKGSPQILSHHTNWRLRALNSVPNHFPENLHYTVVASLSEKDAKQLRTKMLDWISEFLKSVEPSDEETVFCHTLDFFRVVNLKK